MNKIFSLGLAMACAMLFWQCSAEQEGTVIRGSVTNANDLQVFVDKASLGQASSILAKDVVEEGSFELSFPEGLPAGVYKVRIGAQAANLVLDGTESEVEIIGDITTLPVYNFEVRGSQASKTLVSTMQALYQRQYGPEDVRNFVDTVSSPTVGAFVAYQALRGTDQFMDIQKNALQRLQQAGANNELATEYSTYLAGIEQQKMARMQAEPIQVGQPAPDISLQSPDGKTYSLSDLKGKVVLLDFWASWCGPCRRENPNVVKVYDRYKADGFTVFSVSLDGMDSRTAARVPADQQQQYMEQSRQRWINAIEQDNLKWEYHVSDLKKWESAPAALYGVRGIPRTFLIDREGKIAAVNLRGAEQIEAELKKVL